MRLAARTMMGALWLAPLLLLVTAAPPADDRLGQQQRGADEKGRLQEDPEAPAVAFPWIKTVHIVSMTHLDIGGCELSLSLSPLAHCGPPAADACPPPPLRPCCHADGPDSPECENSCRYAADVCNAYIDAYLPAAVATVSVTAPASTSCEPFPYDNRTHAVSAG